jgi:hypothetical protein
VKAIPAAIDYTVIGASGTTEESLQIKIDGSASVVQGSLAKTSSNKRKSIHSDKVKKLEDCWTNGLEINKTGKKNSYNHLCVTLLSKHDVSST